MTRGEEILAFFTKTAAILASLQLGYTDEDIRRLVEEVGSRTERFLKSAVFPGGGEMEFDGRSIA